ncbi:MAG: protein phosphatase 2C domain-containing protein [Alphaproteobacteria bacterium]|nr:protein phosphatase 2C domain-containing protein [Alphaproteobacteria bacterium]
MTNAAQHIKVIATSLQGSLHKSKGLPCQDYCCSKVLKNKLVAVVSDGAGSASYSQIGARLICKTLCDSLIHSNLSNIREDVINAVNTAREKLLLHRLNKTKDENGLINFAATFVGVFCYHNSGIFFHIGDGAGIAFKHGEYDKMIISEPANGAFSCETFFYTMDDWQDYLRFTTFENIDRLILMTDGVSGFVFADDFYKIRSNFFLPIVEYLENTKTKKQALPALINTLNDERAQRLNADDKTFLWAKLP